MLFEFEPDYAVPPGETLKETMESLNITQHDLSHQTGIKELLTAQLRLHRKMQSN